MPCRFYIDTNALYLGGPDFCHGGFPSNFTFDDNSSPRILITLCGVPQPVLQGKFIGQKLIVKYTTVNSYTHNFTTTTADPKSMRQRVTSNSNRT